MNTQDRVNKLMFSKTELAIHKVELNLQQDISKFISEIDDEIDYSKELNKAMDAAWVKTRNAVNDLVKATDEVKNQLPSLDWKADAKDLKAKVKAAADSLGVNPDAVKGYDLIDMAVNDAKEQQAESKMNIKDSKVPKGD
jgi:hypothetical protein